MENKNYCRELTITKPREKSAMTLCKFRRYKPCMPAALYRVSHSHNLADISFAPLIIRAPPCCSCPSRIWHYMPNILNFINKKATVSCQPCKRASLHEACAILRRNAMRAAQAERREGAGRREGTRERAREEEEGTKQTRQQGRRRRRFRQRGE